MATATSLTVNEFLEMSFPEGVRAELIDGEVIQMASGGGPHERVKSNGNLILTVYTYQNPIGRVFPETMYRLSEMDSLQPDLSLLLNEQIPVPPARGLLAFAPALAVEVVSSETAAQLERKIELYLEHGARTVLVLYPEQRAARIFQPGGASPPLRGDQQVQIDWLPGFAVPAAQFFEGL